MHKHHHTRPVTPFLPTQIMAAVGSSRQTLLFSATMPAALAEFARAGLRCPELVRLDADTKISPDLGLAFFTVRCAAGAVQRGGCGGAPACGQGAQGEASVAACSVGTRCGACISRSAATAVCRHASKQGRVVGPWCCFTARALA
jgi:hypothetical protein